MCAAQSKAEARHIDVDALELVRGDLVGFVPDADGVGDELIEGAPVLDHRDSAPVDGCLAAQKTELRISVEFAENRRHGLRYKRPLVEGEETVDAHADEKDDEGASMREVYRPGWMVGMRRLYRKLLSNAAFVMTEPCMLGSVWKIVCPGALVDEVLRDISCLGGGVLHSFVQPGEGCYAASYGVE